MRVEGGKRNAGIRFRGMCRSSRRIIELIIRKSTLVDDTKRTKIKPTAKITRVEHATGGTTERMEVFNWRGWPVRNWDNDYENVSVLCFPSFGVIKIISKFDGPVGTTTTQTKRKCPSVRRVPRSFQ